MTAGEYLCTLNPTRFIQGIWDRNATVGFPGGEDVALQTVVGGRAGGTRESMWRTGPPMVHAWALGVGGEPLKLHMTCFV